jgi:large-conductance mechanosensitive channel
MYESLKEIVKNNTVIAIIISLLIISAIVLELTLWIETIVKIVKNSKQKQNKNKNKNKDKNKNKLNKIKIKEEE